MHSGLALVTCPEHPPGCPWRWNWAGVPESWPRVGDVPGTESPPVCLSLTMSERSLSPATKEAGGVCDSVGLRGPSWKHLATPASTSPHCVPESAHAGLCQLIAQLVGKLTAGCEVLGALQRPWRGCSHRGSCGSVPAPAAAETLLRARPARVPAADLAAAAHLPASCSDYVVGPCELPRSPVSSRLCGGGAEAQI